MRPEKIDYNNALPVKACVQCVEQYPYHWHDALEIVLVLRGSVNVSMGCDDLALREGDIAIANMDEIHRMARTEQDNKILLIHISPAFIKSVIPDGRFLFLYCCTAYHRDQAPQRYDELKKHLARLTAALEKPSGTEQRQAIEGLVKELLDYIVYSFDLLRWGFGATALDDRRVQRLRHMAQRASSAQDMSVGLKDMMSAIDVTLAHLSCDIKETFGLTFQELLFYGKCATAAKLLLRGNERVVDIALNCGFSDVKYLIKHFKRFFGQTPSDFRRQYRADAKALAAQTRYTELPLSEAAWE